MHNHNTLLRFVMLSNVFTCIVFGKSYQGDHLEAMHENANASTLINEIIAKLNDTDPVIQKEPKFFDEFECKCLLVGILMIYHLK